MVIKHKVLWFFSIVVVYFLNVVPVFAGVFDMWDSAADFFQRLPATISYWIWLSFAIVAKMTIDFFDKALKFILGDGDSSLTNMLNSTMVSDGWTIIRDLTNIALVGLFFFFALSFIFGIGIADKKKTLIKLFIVAILINFSALLTKIPIDISNVSLMYFNQLVNKQPPSEGNASLGVGGLNLILGQTLGQQTLEEKNKIENAGKEMSIWEEAGQYLVRSVILLFVAVGFLLITLFLILRAVGFILILITSPIGLAGLVAGWPSGLQTVGQKWGKYLMDFCIQLPMVLLLFFIATHISGSTLKSYLEGAGEITFGEFLFFGILSMFLIILPFLPLIANLFKGSVIGRAAEQLLPGTVRNRLSFAGAQRSLQLAGGGAQRVGREVRATLDRVLKGRVPLPGTLAGRVRGYQKKVGETQDEQFYKDAQVRADTKFSNLGGEKRMVSNREKLETLDKDIATLSEKPTLDNQEKEVLREKGRERNFLITETEKLQESKKNKQELSRFEGGASRKAIERRIKQLEDTGKFHESMLLKRVMEAQNTVAKLKRGEELTSEDIKKMNLRWRFSNLKPFTPTQNLVAERMVKALNREEGDVDGSVPGDSGGEGGSGVPGGDGVPGRSGR